MRALPCGVAMGLPFWTRGQSSLPARRGAFCRSSPPVG
jgi:hypothetical protein